ncbi:MULTISPECIES: hypothetical protein [unclassified Pseudomonas]|jgi:hypothetical protein|uniref:hypothetical protein n=1 Tax=unclassified Pseudomonas TaxID=196821 RepID=UPI00070263DB|nr:MULTISPECIES: hypothetical protein [unclassified Pseudomonas]KQZ94877.1 hypothetical protein ASD60_02435 [Pseudomonas sp. Root562]
MDDFESSVSVSDSADFVRACINKRKSVLTVQPRTMSLSSSVVSSPTKELDALVLGNSLIGYGDQISIENMAIIENLITMSKMEANIEVPGNKDPKAWYHAFTSCMEDLGCFVPDKGYSKYSATSLNITMDNVMVDIIQAAVDAAKTAIPGATALSALTNSTLAALKKEPEAINLFNTQAKNTEGVRLSTIPCEQMANGIILIAVGAVDHQGGGNDGGLLFVDWKTSSLNIFHGKSFITFNPARYAYIKSDIEEYLGIHRKEILAKRFSRRK